MRSGIRRILSKFALLPMKSRGRRIAREYQRSLGTLRLDLGCGAFRRKGFIGIDISPQADIQWDLTWGLPFVSETIQEIRSDHFLEHLDLPLVVHTLAECHRVLVPGGLLDFSVPHLDPYLKAYQSGDFELLKEKIFDVPEGQSELYGTCFDRISWLLLRGGEHKSLFDKQAILHKLNLAGFTDVRVRDFDPDRDNTFRFSSCHVVAVK